MSRFEPNELDLGPEADPEERDALTALAVRLERDRPIAPPGFRGELRRDLLGRMRTQPWRPQRLRAMITAYASSGAVLLVVAALSVGGVGPLSAG